MSDKQPTYVQDFSLSVPTTVGGTELFPEASPGSFLERTIYNPHATQDAWIAMSTPGTTDAAPAANALKSIRIPANGGSWSGAVCNQIKAIGTTGATPLTAHQR